MIHQGPYTNLHDLNVDWILQIVKEFFDKYNTIDNFIEAAENQLTSKKDELTAQLLATSIDLTNAYNENATEKLQALQDVYNYTIGQLNNISQGKIEELRNVGNAQIDAVNLTSQNAQNTINALIQSIPSDFSDLVDSIAKGYTDLSFPIEYNTLCWQNGTLYRAKIIIPTSEAWDATHWEVADVSDAIIKAMTFIATEHCFLDRTQRTQANINLGSVMQENIAPIQSYQQSTIAINDYKKGEYFFMNGLLYVATIDIDAGDNIIVNTNCKFSMLSDDIIYARNEALKVENKAPAIKATENGQSVTLYGENASLIDPLNINFDFNSTAYTNVTINESNKNILGGIKLANKIKTFSQQYVTIDTTNKTVTFPASISSNKIIIDKVFKPNTQYTFIFSLSSSNANTSCNLRVRYTDGTNVNIPKLAQTAKQTIIYKSRKNATIQAFTGANVQGSNTLYYDEFGIFEGIINEADFVEHEGITKTLTLPENFFGGEYDVNNGLIISKYDSSGNILDPAIEYDVPEEQFETIGHETHLWSDNGSIEATYNETIEGYVSEQINDAKEELSDKLIVVAPTGGNYTSLSEAIYENLNNGIEIIVKPGTYNIENEYIALFGEEIVNSFDDNTDSMNGFQFGIRVQNRKITFEPGSYVVCDWTNHIVNGTHRFSAFSIGADAEIIGLKLHCIHTFYAIHDDYGSISDPITKIYRNCHITATNLTNQNIIGGGCRPYSKVIIDNCYFDNGGIDTEVCVRYHNSNVANSEPEVWVTNSYFAQRLSFRYYGAQTTKMKAYVCGCTAQKIYKGAEGASTNDNVDLYKWNNTELNP